MNTVNGYVIMPCDEEEYHQNLIVEREKDIIKTASDIHKVNEIFKDIGQLVTEQQGDIDDIESQINNAAENTAEGVNQLDKAKQNQKIRNKCYLYVFGFSIVMIFVLFLVLKIK